MLQETELSVLLIEDEPDAARLIQYALSKGSADSAVVEWAADLHTGLARLGERRFQAVVLDLNLPDSSGYETFASVRQKAPEAAVIVLTAQEDENLALQAVRGGADEYLIKSEVRDRFLLQRIRHAVERNRLKHANRRLVKNGKIYSFLGAKGGAGTTTLVVNAAAALAQTGKTVIAMELGQEYSSFAAMFHHSPAWDISALLRGAEEAISEETVMSCLEESGSGFTMLCGPRLASDHGPLSAAQVRSLLGVVHSLADYTLLDLPATLAPPIEEVLHHSALTTLVVERNRIGLHAALAKMPVLNALAARSGAIGAVLVNKTHYIEFLSPAEFSSTLGCEVLAVLPPAAELLAAQEGHATNESLPVLSRSDTFFSQAILEFASRISAAPARFRAS